MWRGLLFILVLGCSSKHAPPPSAESERGNAHDVLFVPAELVNHLAGEDMILAIDVSHSDMSPLLAQIPPDIACLGDLLKSMGVLVMAARLPSQEFTAFATHLDQQQTRQCFDKITSAAGGKTSTGSDGSYEVPDSAFGFGFAFSWKGQLATARKLGAPLPAPGVPNQKLLALAGKLPVDARVFMIGDGWSERKIASMLMWLKFSDEFVDGTMQVEGTEPSVAQEWVHGFSETFKKGFGPKVPGWSDDWMKESGSGLTATLDVHFPLAAFRRVRSKP